MNGRAVLKKVVTVGWAVLKQTPIMPEHMAMYQLLFDLQASGRINMMGAPAELEKIGYDRREAQDIVSSWMDNYEELSQTMSAGRGAEMLSEDDYPEEAMQYELDEDFCNQCEEHSEVRDGLCAYCWNNPE